MTNQDTTPPAILHYEQFEPLLNQEFRVTIGDETLILTLTEARLSRFNQPDNATRRGFSLLFRCKDQRILPQIIHPIWNEHLGHQEIFFVPVAADAEGVSYEAVFS